MTCCFDDLAVTGWPSLYSADFRSEPGCSLASLLIAERLSELSSTLPLRRRSSSFDAGSSEPGAKFEVARWTWSASDS